MSKFLKVKLTFTEPILGMQSDDKKTHSTYIASKAPTAEKAREEEEAMERAVAIEQEREKQGNVKTVQMPVETVDMDSDDDDEYSDEADKRKIVNAAVSDGDMLSKAPRTIFPRNADGVPILWDYQIKGYFKDACGMLNRTIEDGKKSGIILMPYSHKKVKVYKLQAYKRVIDGTIFAVDRQIPIHFKGETFDTVRPLRAQTMQGERITIATSESIPAGATVEFTIECLKDSDMEKYVLPWLDYGELRGMGQWRNASYGRFDWIKLPLDEEYQMFEDEDDLV